MTKRHCKRCKGEVEMHYDHVEGCRPGCTGTFKHKRSLVGGRRCDLAFENLTHAQVSS